MARITITGEMLFAANFGGKFLPLLERLGFEDVESIDHNETLSQIKPLVDVYRERYGVEPYTAAVELWEEQAALRSEL